MKMYINYFQNTKTDMTDRVIKDKALNSMAHNYIKAQTQFAHMLYDNTESLWKYFFDTVSKGKGAKDEQ